MCHFCASSTFPIGPLHSWQPGNSWRLVSAMEATNLATNPLVYYAWTGNQFKSYLSMRCVQDAGNQELLEALQIQGGLIGNLEHEKARMTAQFNLLDQELTRRAQRGTLATTMGISGNRARSCSQALLGNHRQQRQRVPRRGRLGNGGPGTRSMREPRRDPGSLRRAGRRQGPQGTLATRCPQPPLTGTSVLQRGSGLATSSCQSNRVETSVRARRPWIWAVGNRGHPRCMLGTFTATRPSWSRSTRLAASTEIGNPTSPWL